MSELSALGKQQREELIEVVAESLNFTSKTFMQRAIRVVEVLEKRGVVSFHTESKTIPYNPAWTHGGIGADEAALMEQNGWRMRPDGSYFKPGS